MRTSMSCARRRLAAKLYAAAMPCGLATGAFVLAISTASAQSNPYSNPSVIVDLSVLEKFGPPPTLPGLLRQGGQSTGGQNTGAQPATRDGAAAGAPGRLLPPPSAKPQSHVTLPKANQPDGKRVARPAVPRAKPKAALDMPEPPPAPPKADIPKKKPAPPPKAVAGTPEAGEDSRTAAIPPPKITPPPPPKSAAAEAAKPPARQAEKSVMPKMTPPPPPPQVTAPPVPTATAEPESPAKKEAATAAPSPKVPDNPASTAMAPSATPETPPQPPAAAPASPESGTEKGKDEEKQVATRAAGPAKVSADGKTIDILFPAGSSELPGSVDPALGELAQRLKADESLRLDILGYAAGEAESASQARRLSLFRALAVRSHLMKQGILSTRMNVRALGNNVEGDAPVDRVEIVVVQQ